jgi:hypothetical protein
MNTFWDAIDTQLAELRSTANADDVLRILPADPCSAGEGFFAGSGGDGTVMAALHETGWTVTWSEAPYRTARSAVLRECGHRTATRSPISKVTSTAAT